MEQHIEYTAYGTRYRVEFDGDDHAFWYAWDIWTGEWKWSGQGRTDGARTPTELHRAYCR